MHTITESRNGAQSCLVLPDGSPSYVELLADRDRAIRENAKLVDEIGRLVQKAADYWETIEDVACGATLECVKCNKPRPCLCQDAHA